MSSLYLWIKFIHVVAGITFIMGHGAAIAFAFRVKKETAVERVRAMLDLSGSMWPVYMLSWLALMIAGIVNGFMHKLWSQGWIWVSLVLFIAITIWMFTLSPITQSLWVALPEREGRNACRRPTSGTGACFSNRGYPPCRTAGCRLRWIYPDSVVDDLQTILDRSLRAKDL